MPSRWINFFAAKCERLEEEFRQAKRLQQVHSEREKLLRAFRDGTLRPTEAQIEELYWAISAERQATPDHFIEPHANACTPQAATPVDTVKSKCDICSADWDDEQWSTDCPECDDHYTNPTLPAHDA